MSIEKFYKKIKKKQIYFIADIAANHDGSLSRAKKLIRLCAKAGADAAKFQHFKAETIVSDYGFKKIGKLSHQNTWKKSIFEIYKAASINFKWTKELLIECKKYGIDFMTSPYDLEYIDMVDKYIAAYKIGSGDITWLDAIKKISKKNKPVILATGASTMRDVDLAVKNIFKYQKKIVLMQCNTNYTASIENYKSLNLNVLNTYKKKYKNKIVLGLSDHTKENISVLGAITMGARVIEKHFTDDNTRSGPDHYFSLNYKSWKKMVQESKLLLAALGNGIKKVEFNEQKTISIQRRSIRANRNIKVGEIINKKDIISLRPITKNGFAPTEINKILNKKVISNIHKGDEICKKNIKI